jgi:hypothetical protein
MDTRPEAAAEQDGHTNRYSTPQFDVLYEASEAAARRSADLREQATTIRAASATSRGSVQEIDREALAGVRAGMAIGILMARRRLTEEQAFDCLRIESQHRNVKLRDIAESVIYTGDI